MAQVIWSKHNPQTDGHFFGGTGKGIMSLGSPSLAKKQSDSASSGSTKASPAEPGAELENWMIKIAREQMAREQSNTAGHAQANSLTD